MAVKSVAPASQAGWAIERLAEFVTTAPDQHGPLALERSRLAVIDTIGCMFFGHTSEEAQAALATVLPWGKGDAIVVGGNEVLPPPWAAFVNATAAHALDFDDWDDPSLSHTSAVLLPAILAALSERGGSGRDLLDAHIVGVEILLRIGEAVNPSHYWKGWHATATIGAIGCAAAVARIMGLDAGKTANALSIATSMAGGYVSQFGTMTKPMHAGLAAKAGIFAASLARSGTTSQPAALDGSVSFRSVMSDAKADAFSKPLAKLGEPWAIEEYGLHVKLYPSCGGTHRAIEAGLKLHQTYAIAPDDIVDVELNVPEFLGDLLPYRVPRNRTEALFSLPYCTAVALCRGRVGIDEFSNEALRSQDILTLASRVRLKLRSFNYVTHLFVKDSFDVVTIKTMDGQTLSAAVDIPYGAPPRFADTETVQKKFTDCAIRAISKERSIEILELFDAAPDAWSFEQLSHLLSADAATAS